jgi:hypothetical protein
MAAGQGTPRGEAEWAAILDDMQASIAATLERTPEPEALTPPSDPAEPGRGRLDALNLGMNEMRASLERAEQCVAETDALLQAEAEVMVRWNQAVKEVREKLANWATSPA